MEEKYFNLLSISQVRAEMFRLTSMMCAYMNFSSKTAYKRKINSQMKDLRDIRNHLF